MKLKELIAELEHFNNNGHFDEIDDIGDLELSFKLMVKNTDLQDDDIWDIDLSKPEIICSTGNFFVEFGMTAESNIPNKSDYVYYFKDVHPNEFDK
tara:strand:- start:5703 stop:5990 length:288 start_codon:yes stop_codon:yes gene_type:complete